MITSIKIRTPTDTPISLVHEHDTTDDILTPNIIKSENDNNNNVIDGLQHTHTN